MICLFLVLAFTFVCSALVFFVTSPYILDLIFRSFEFCDYATIETFIEIALIFFILVKKYADENCRKPVLVFVIAFLISVTFVGLAIYQSTLIILDTPVSWLYHKIYDFFDFITNYIVNSLFDFYWS